jgi:hypothetical protein
MNTRPLRILLPLAICLSVAPSRADDEANALSVQLARSMMSEEKWGAYQRSAIEQASQLVPEESREDFQAAMTKMFPSYQEHVDLTAGLLAKYYTADELKELAAFYRTPLGQKSIRVMPEVMRDAMGMLNERMQHEMPKLIQSIRHKHDKK